MSNICLCWELGAGSGHCANLLPIGKHLVDRGHVVTIVARSTGTAARVFKNTGVNVIEAPCSEQATEGNDPAASYPSILLNCGFSDRAALANSASQWRELFERIKPQITVFEHSPTALLASRWIDCKRVLIGTGFTNPPDIFPMPEFTLSEFGRSAIDELKALANINSILAENGLPELGRLGQLFSEVDDTLLTTYQELDHYPARSPATYSGCWALPEGVAPIWPQGAGRKVFCYLPMVSHAAPLIAALAASGLRVLAYIPGDAGIQALFNGKQISIVSEPLNLAQVACQCDFAVTNGSAGTTAFLLQEGVPVLVVPGHIEQQILGQRVAELGAGTWANPWNPRAVADGIADMLRNPSYRDSAKAFAKKYELDDPRSAAMRAAERVAMFVDRELR
jgi:UDP:flavonoid glycosyltransferase YjiC (YdhE family)